MLAAAFAVASETARIAFAPSFDLFGVPSSSIIALSTPAWSLASIPTTRFAITSFTFATAFSTPLPWNLFPPSLSSSASWTPFEAPAGTAAVPHPPPAVATSASTVGFPLESRIHLPLTKTTVKSSSTTRPLAIEQTATGAL